MKGDVVVYSPHGIGVIEGIVGIDGGECYVLKFKGKNASCIIPVSESHKLRSICEPGVYKHVIEILAQNKDVECGRPWVRRYKEYTERIKLATALQIAEILRDLKCICLKKNLSFWEKDIFGKALGILTQELAFSLGRNENEIVKEILNTLGVEWDGNGIKPKSPPTSRSR